MSTACKASPVVAVSQGVDAWKDRGKKRVAFAEINNAGECVAIGTVFETAGSRDFGSTPMSRFAMAGLSVVSLVRFTGLLSAAMTI